MMTEQQEVRWHVAQMLPRLKLKRAIRERAVALLRGYLTARSSIVKTCAMEALAKLSEDDPALLRDTMVMLKNPTQNGSAAMRSRGRKLLGKLEGLDVHTRQLEE